MKKVNKGFTLIELLVVIAIIVILSTLAVVALGSARIKSRDGKRVADIRQMMSALDLYYNDAGSYPTLLATGDSIKTISATYMAVVPANPSPRNDGNCPSEDYSYTATGATPTTYSISYCLGGQTADLGSGTHTATPAGINN